MDLGFQENILLSVPRVFLMGYAGGSTNLPLRGIPRQAVTPQQPAGMDGGEQSWKPLHHHPAEANISSLIKIKKTYLADICFVCH